MCIQGFGGETCEKYATWKTQCYMEGYYLNGFLRDRMGALTGLVWHRTGTSVGAFVSAAMNVRIPYNARNF